jgi:hypothetical protein
MRYIRGFAHFCYDFVVGDDWTVAVAVVVAITATWLLAHHGIPAWWMMPLAVTATLIGSLARATRR